MNRKPVNIVDRPLSRGKGEVSLSAFAFLFSEIIQYCQGRVESSSALEKKLSEIGHRVGVRMFELLSVREKGSKREIRLINILYFINSVVWKALFGKQADLLEKDNSENESKYMISDKELLVNKYISLPKDSGLNCGAFVAGIVEAILEGSNYPAKVSAHSTDNGTTLLIKFEPSAIERDRLLEGK